MGGYLTNHGHLELAGAQIILEGPNHHLPVP